MKNSKIIPKLDKIHYYHMTDAAEYMSDKIFHDVPLLKNIYAKYYAKYKFLNCKTKLYFNISKPELFVHWLSTYNCNFHCEFCEANAGDKKNIQELDTEEVCKLMAELGKMKVKRIFIGGGEPLIRKDLFIIIRNILDVGMQYGISSNSYYVSKFKEEFIKFKPYMFFTSIDGLKQTNDKIRMSGAFDKSLQALEFFKSIDVGYRVVNTVVTPKNIGELSQLKKIILDSDATFWRFALAIPVGRASKDNKMYLSDQQVKYLFNFVEDTSKEFDVEITEDAGYLGCLSLKLRSHPFFCGAGLTRCSVMPDGEVFGCQISYDNRYSEGNIRNLPFKEIWQKGFSRFRNPQFNKECLDCKYVSSCRGGCWGMRLENMHCLKRIWEQNCSNH